jgi:hypothetical protein
MKAARLGRAPLIDTFSIQSAAASPRIPRFACAGFPRSGTLYIAGSANGAGSTGTFSHLTDSAGRSIDARDQQAYSEALGFDGVSGWRRDRSGGTHRLNSPVALEMARGQAWLDKRGWCLPGLGGASLAKYRVAVDGGVSYDVFKVAARAARPLELWFDPSSGILRRAVLQLKGTTLSHRYSDWRKIPRGPLVAYSQTDEYVEEEEKEELRVREVRVQNTRSFDAFAMPGQPRDHFIRGGRKSTTVAYQGDGNVIFIPVKIASKGPYPFLLDTGGHLHLTSEIAAATGQKHKGATTTFGPTAAVASSAVSVSELSIGDAVLLRQHAGVLPLKTFGTDRRPKAPMAGLIGLELFTRFTVEIDKRRRIVTLRDIATPPVPRGTAVPIVFSEDAPILAGTVEGKPGLFVVDSGNSGSTILQTGWANRNGLQPVLRRGVPGRAQAIGAALEQIISRASVGVGPFVFPNEVVSFLPGRPTTPGEHESDAGNIGQRILRHFNEIWDYKRGKVWLELLPEVEPLPFNRVGLGVLKDDDGMFKIALVNPGSPGEAAGIKVSDRITRLNGRPAPETSRGDAVNLFTQPVGTVVILNVCSMGGACRDIPLKLREVLPLIEHPTRVMCANTEGL